MNIYFLQLLHIILQLDINKIISSIYNPNEPSHIFTTDHISITHLSLYLNIIIVHYNSVKMNIIQIRFSYSSYSFSSPPSDPNASADHLLLSQIKKFIITSMVFELPTNCIIAHLHHNQPSPLTLFHHSITSLSHQFQSSSIRSADCR